MPSSHRSATSSGRSLLDLVRLGGSGLPPGGEELYRQVGQLAELAPGKEVLVVACGRGASTLFLTKAFGIETAGIEGDPDLVREAEELAREAGEELRTNYQSSSLERLPFRDDVFDVTVGEIGVAASPDPGAVIREMARVTKPLGTIVLVQLIWTGNVDAARRAIVVEGLGGRPMIAVEWKQLLREAGVVELTVEDWSDAPSPFRPAEAPGDAPLLTPRYRAARLWDAFRRSGWRGARDEMVRERELLRLLSAERVLGLSVIKGTRWRATDT